ncbi:MAG: 6-carboxytetrahydropterin synthase [bacterium JZ-2024 1]
MLLLTKRFEFCASHRYWNPNWDEKKNLEVFGKTTSIHGHNYILEVTIQGEISPQTGMIVNVTRLKEWIQPILEEFDHRYLNEDIPEFREMIPTTENLARVLFQRIRGVLPVEIHLAHIRLWESDDLWAEYSGGEEVGLGRKYGFSAAHRLYSPFLSREENERTYEKCSRPSGHGHSYSLELLLKGPVESQTGFVVHLHLMDSTVRSLLDRWDHKWLDRDVPEFREGFSTAENILYTFIQQFQKIFPFPPLVFARLWETPSIWVAYTNKGKV